MTDQPETPKNFISLAVIDGGIFAVSAETGRLYPLYVFSPLQNAVDLGNIPELANHWWDFMFDFLKDYKPMPAQKKIALPLDLYGDIRTQSRAEDPNRPWEQMTYKYWPLYYARHGVESHNLANRPVLFSHARTDMHVLHGIEQDSDSPDVGWPPGTLGP